MDWIPFILCLIILSLLAIYIFVKRSLSYWKRHGVPYNEPEFPWGNTKGLFKQELSFGEQVAKFYNEFKSRGLAGGGVYFGLSQVYIPVDLELTKNILQKDFNHFINHGVYVNEADDPLSGNLFALEDERWKYLRAKQTPAFTSGKLKMMFQTMAACADSLKEVLNVHSLVQDPVDIKDVVSRFTADIIGSCAFGIECNSLKNPSSEFIKYGRRVFEPDTTIDQIKGILFLFIPRKILKALHAKLTNKDVEKFFMGVVNDTLQYREKNNIHRNDFMHLMMQLKNQGKLSDDDNFKTESVVSALNTDEGLTTNEITAQCVGFFVAAFETSATTMTFSLLELALNQDIQDKLRREISNVLAKYEGKVSYEAIMEMNYLDKVVHESLRKHPPFPFLLRVCNKAYKIPGTDIVLKPRTKIQIPVLGIHRDPNYYPNPDHFDPERFNEEGKSQRNPLAFLVFGEGPRYCIGDRFGLLQVKIGLVTIINNFKVTLNNRTKTPIKYNTKHIINNVDGDVWLNISALK